jgi:hypothetical protein
VCAVTGEVLWGPQRGRKMNAGEALAAAGWLVLLASAAGCLRAGRRAVSAGGGLPNEFR